MLAKHIDVEQVRTNLRELLTLVQSGGEVILTEGDTPVARLVPVETVSGWGKDDDSGAIQPPLIREDVEAQLASLRAGFAAIREGLSREELDEMIAMMNEEYIEPEDPTVFGDDHLTEDDR